VSARTRFDPAGPLRGDYTPPADKSISHRAALFGAMCDEPVPVRNFLDSEDTRSTLDAVMALGAGVEEEAENCFLIRGVGLHAPLEATEGLLNVGNAGTLMRLLPGWLAGQPGGVWTLDGDASIRRRPVDRVAEPLRLMGATVNAREGRFPPFTVHGAPLTGIDYELPMSSAQVKSCVLIAGLTASGSTTVREPSPSRDHTERLLRRARAPFEQDGLESTVSQVDELELDEVVVPGDPSSAAFVVAAAILVDGSRVVLKDVGLNWTRTGFLRIAERMGAVIVGDLEEPGTESDQEPVGELDVASGPLEATVVEPGEVPLAIDELTLVALLGAHADGETVVRGAAELRLKESDRIAGVVEGLRGLGADIEELRDGFAVRGDGSPLRGGTIDAKGDHRMAMLGAVAGLASTEGVEVVGMEASGISYPRFERDIGALIAG
jgi:3-phosphoshikimate 1-carboxyvinyltransferase